jgi:hypothetical protein
MGSLKPGATYVYERVNDTVYAREVGSSERRIIGYKYDNEKMTDVQKEDTFLGVPMSEMMLMAVIIQESKNNELLRQELERVKITYHLSKENGRETRT